MQLTNSVQDLVLNHQDYLKALARTIHQRLPRSVDLEELVQYGQIGLLEAAAKYDSQVGASFKTYAYTRIRGAIFDGIGKLRDGPNRQYESHELRAYVARENGLNEVGERVASELPHCDDADMTYQLFERAVRDVANVIILSRVGEEAVQGAFLDSNHEEMVANNELCQRIVGAIQKLPHDQATIIRLHYFEGRLFTECARVLGKHKAWISRLHARALSTLRELVCPEPTLTP